MRQWFVAIAAAAVLAGAAAREAGAEQYFGRTIADVRVEVAGTPLADPGVLELVETRIGEPLTMINVRATIDHLVGLGRFEDVRMYGAPSDQGTIVRWALTPVRHIGLVEVDGTARISEAAIRSELADRFGGLPSANRVLEMVGALEAFYADRGFRRATILPRLEDDDRQPERVKLILTIEAGTRAAVGQVTVRTTPLAPEAEVRRQLDLAAGQPFDRTELDARIEEYEEDLRGLGYYEARVRQTHDFAVDGQTVAVEIEVAPGPRVRVVFDGDSLPEDEREALVPIRQERSVDQDLLEDASRAIEEALRGQGYRAAQAPFARQQTGDEVVLTFTITRGPQHQVESVDVLGQSGMTRADIAPLLQIEPGDPFVESRVGAVAAAIAEVYRVRGYSQVAVKPLIQVLPQETRAGVSFRPVDLKFDIQEGGQTIVTAVTFEGTSAISAEQLTAQMAMSAGRPFYRPQLAADRDSLERAYRNLGYQSVSVISQLAFADQQRSVAVTWTVREGQQIRVDRVLIKGNVRTGVDLIRRELTIRAGSPMSDDALIESQRQLAATGLFRRVRVTELPRTGSNTRDVLVDLEEAPATTVTYGGGLEVGVIGRRSEEDRQAEDQLDIAPRAFFDISRRNLWGKNRSITFFGRVTLRKTQTDEEDVDGADTGGYGLNDYRGLFTFREPRAFGTTGDAQLTGFVEQGLRTSFDFNRKGVTADYAKRFSTITVTGRYTFDSTKVFNTKIALGDQLLIDRLFPQIRLSKVFGSILRDSRDDVLDPQKGSVLGLDGSVAAKVMGSEVGFVKTFAQGFIYRRLPGRGFVIAAGARVGVAVGFKQEVEPPREIAEVFGDVGRETRAAVFPSVIREVPASERFFAGGDTTVRGFALDRLGTADTLDRDGFPKGGNGLAVFNLEARAPYWKNLQFVWFADAGNVFEGASDIRLDELRLTSGLGFRYRSPIGPLRVDWGFKLSTRLLSTGGRERSNVFHVSLGQAF